MALPSDRPGQLPQRLPQAVHADKGCRPELEKTVIARCQWERIQTSAASSAESTGSMHPESKYNRRG